MKKIGKIALFAAFLPAFCVPVFADEVTVTLNITGVKVNGGTVFAAVYDSAESYKKDTPCQELKLEPSAEALSTQVNLNEGFYRFSVFQDTNGDGKFNTGLFGIPKEPFGISNYKGSGIPGGFDKLKVKVEPGMGEITVHLSPYKF